MTAFETAAVAEPSTVPEEPDTNEQQGFLRRNAASFTILAFLLAIPIGGGTFVVLSENSETAKTVALEYDIFLHRCARSNSNEPKLVSGSVVRRVEKVTFLTTSTAVVTMSGAPDVIITNFEVAKDWPDPKSIDNWPKKLTEGFRILGGPYYLVTAPGGISSLYDYECYDATKVMFGRPG